MTAAFNIYVQVLNTAAGTFPEYDLVETYSHGCLRVISLKKNDEITSFNRRVFYNLTCRRETTRPDLV